MTFSASTNYHNKQFVPQQNSENGEVNRCTIFYYYQQGNVLWGDYSGGDILKGSIIGLVSDSGELDFYYQHVNVKNQIRIGKCHSTPKMLDTKKIQLFEEWEWLNGDMSRGTSVIIEK